MDVRRLDEMQAQGRSIFDTELAVAYYARVSTDKDEQINSLGNQKRYFEDYIAANPHWRFAGGYVDEGISGTSVEGREQFLKMIEDAKRGRFDLIVTKEISRFARNTLDSLRYTRELLRCGVGVYFQNDNINTFDKDAELRLTIMSFGFKFGLPPEADLVLDVRCLPNPFYVPELKHKTGLDQEVVDFVLSHPEAQELLRRYENFLQYALPLYVKEGKSQLTIAVGCTGGKHRSITFARKLAEYCTALGYEPGVQHRDAVR